MIKKVLLIISIFLLAGCSTKEISLDKQKYNSYVEILNKETYNSDYLPCNIEVYVDKIVETEVMYRVIIDKPKIALRNIEAIAMHDKYTEDVFPSSGIFEEKYSLIPNVINKSSNYAEGIILIGYIPFDGDLDNLDATFKVMIKYTDDDGEEHTIMYSTKK